VVEDDVEVVEEPFSCGADLAPGGGAADAGVGVDQDPAGGVEAFEERGAATGTGADLLGAGDGAGALREGLGAEELTSEGTAEQVLRSGGRAGEAAEPAAGARGSRGGGAGDGALHEVTASTVGRNGHNK
jgi:hypothetical protein